MNLEPVTARENTLRSSSFAARFAKATHCVNGHPFDEENTYQRPTGGRACRTCRKAVNTQRQQRRRSEQKVAS